MEIAGIPHAVEIGDDTLRQLLTQKRWAVEGHDKSPAHFPCSAYELTVHPFVTHQVSITHNRFGMAAYFDRELAETTTDDAFGVRISLKQDAGYRPDMEAQASPAYLWRGISWEELNFIRANRIVQSTGAYNFGNQQGLTYFAEDPDMARCYASSYQPYPWLPTFGRPAYVLKVRRPEAGRLDTVTAPRGEVGVQGPLDISFIEAVTEVRPYCIKAGSVSLRYDNQGELPDTFAVGTLAAPKVDVAYRLWSTAELKALCGAEPQTSATAAPKTPSPVQQAVSSALALMKGIPQTLSDAVKGTAATTKAANASASPTHGADAKHPFKVWEPRAGKVHSFEYEQTARQSALIQSQQTRDSFVFVWTERRLIAVYSAGADKQLDHIRVLSRRFVEWLKKTKTNDAQKLDTLLEIL